VPYVDDDFNESTPGWGVANFNNLQFGIDALEINGTVYVIQVCIQILFI